MDDVIVNALAGESVIFSNAVATVTTSCIILRERERGATVVIAVEKISNCSKVKFTHPQLLVFSAGMLTLAAASYASKQGMEVVIPMAVVALMLALGYLGTRRAALLVLVANDGIETLKASYGEVESIIRQLKRVRAVSLLSH